MVIKNNVADVYRERSERFRRELDRQGQRLDRITHGRLATFLAVLALLPASEVSGSLRGFMILAAIAFFLGFIALVVVHRRTAQRVRHHGELQKINVEAVARLRRDWGGLPEQRAESPSEDHPYAEDLNLFGPASLYQLVCAAVTPLGQGTLFGWLLQPADPDVIAQRQEAVADLAEQIDLRDELAARGRLMGQVNPHVVDRFLTWSVGDRWILNRPWMIAAGWFLPIATAVLLVLHVTGVLAYPFWAISFICGLLLMWRTGEKIEQIFEAASSGETALRRFSGVFEAVSAGSFKAPHLVRIQRVFAADDVPAHKQMRRLDRILACSDVRLSGMLHFVVQSTTFWDFHVLATLERWREANRQYVGSWFSAYGELEAFSSLAGLAHAHPHWVYPELTGDGTAELSAAGLGHPLLRPERCVTNDVHIGPPGKFLLVTGSNMSGKSTLLRAIGHRRERCSRPGRWAGVRLPPATTTLEGVYQHARPRLVGAGSFSVHGGSEKTQAHRRRRTPYRVRGCHFHLLAGRDSSGDQCGRTSNRRPQDRQGAVGGGCGGRNQHPRPHACRHRRSRGRRRPRVLSGDHRAGHTRSHSFVRLQVATGGRYVDERITADGDRGIVN